jgi:hypothetical protein
VPFYTAMEGLPSYLIASHRSAPRRLAASRANSGCTPRKVSFVGRRRGDTFIRSALGRQEA